MTNETSTSTPPRRLPTGQRLYRSLNRYIEPVARGVGPPIVGPGIVVVETTGRRTGLPRRVPLLGWRHGTTITVSTIRTNSDWIRNLERRPVARVWIAGHPRTSTATVVRSPAATVVHLDTEARPSPRTVCPAVEHTPRVDA